MQTESSKTWKDVFTTWPEGVPRRGVVVSSLNEITPFKGFMLKGDVLLLERTNPDPLGARYIVMGFEAIHMVKLIDPLKESVFTTAGFSGHLAKS